MKREEDEIQKAVIQHLRVRGVKGLVYFHVPNGLYAGPRGYKQIAKFKSMGFLPGVSDICLLHDGRFYALELKAKGKNLTEAQLKFRDDVNNAGGFACSADSLNKALYILEEWQLIGAPLK